MQAGALDERGVASIRETWRTRELVGGVLDAAAWPFDAVTQALSTDLQAQYRAMRHQLSALSTVGVPREL